MGKASKNAFIRLKRFTARILERAEKDGDRLIFVPIIVYTLIFSAYTCYMHYTFKTFAWDLGITTQPLWTTLHSGKIMYSTLEVPYGNPSGSFFGVHFSPILFLVLPVYALFQAPETLLIFQSFILAVAALPLYWIARDKLDRRLYGLAFAVAYLLNPALHGVNTFDFHVEIFTPAFLLFAFYFLDKGSWFKAILFIVLELATIEFAPILVLFLGFYFFLKRILEGRSERKRISDMLKKIAAPAAIMIVSIFCFYLAFYVIATVNPLKTGGPAGVWKYWGSNIFEVAGNIVRNPTDALIVLATPIDKPYFLIFLLGSAFFLPLFAPLELLMSVPWLLVAFLSDYQPYYQPYYQYSALVLGQLFIAAVFGFRRLFHSEERSGSKSTVQRKVIIAMLVANVFLFLAVSPAGIPAFTNRGIRPYSINTSSDPSHVAELHKVLSFIPADASVATIQNIFPHVCQRLNAFNLKWPLDYEVDYIIVDVKSSTYTWSIYGPHPSEIVVTLMNSGKYGILASSDGAILFKKGYGGPPEYFTPQRDIFNSDELSLGSGRVLWDYSSSSTRVISSDPANSRGFIWFGPYRYFAPGNYSITFRMKTADETCKLLLDVATNQGSTVIAQRSLKGTEFKKLNEWQDFSVCFKLEVPTSLEFRGYCLSDNIKVELDYIRIEQYSLP
jgi:uncharacterized membrane protein